MCLFGGGGSSSPAPPPPPVQAPPPIDTSKDNAASLEARKQERLRAQLAQGQSSTITNVGGALGLPGDIGDAKIKKQTLLG